MIETITSSVSLAKDGFAFLNFVKDIVGSDVVSAYFRYDGTKVEGSDIIEVELHKDEGATTYWLNVKPVNDYIFVRMPLNSDGCYEKIACIDGNPMPDPNYWKWVSSPDQGVIVGGGQTLENAKVDFIIVGYKPKAIIKHFSTTKK